MDISEITAISEFGMNFERLRMQVASTNIAFANQLSSSPETTFKPLKISTEGIEKFAEPSMTSMGSITESLKKMQMHIVPVSSVKPKYDPDNAAADSAGFVYRPNVSLVSEMLALTTATRAYEANIRAFNTAKSMSAKALEIGKR